MTKKFEGHTEGPWHVGEIVQSGPDGENQTIEICNYEMFVNQRREYVIAHVFDGEIDAALIAAAPDLLERVKVLEEALRGIAHDTNGYAYQIKHGYAYQLKQIARDALDKSFTIE